MVSRRIFLARTALAGAALSFPAIGVAADTDTVFDIEPGTGNPRNSEGAFAALRSGRVLFLYTRFYGGAGDASAADLVQIHSDDAGRTWSREPRKVIGNHGGENIMSVSLLRLQNGKLVLFYLVKNSSIDCRPVLRVSSDEGGTWSEPITLTTAPGYFVLNNDRVIQLKNGRLVAPLALHRSRSSDSRNKTAWDRRAIAVWLLSDDEGKSWQESDDWWALPARTRSGLQEPGVVELDDGRLFSWMRTDQGCQYGCWSNDNGRTWDQPARTSLMSPESPASIKRIPGSTSLLAVYNDHSGEFPFEPGKRTPLVTAVSKDGGKTWTDKRVIEADPDGWFCYTAIDFCKDGLLLAYCAGDKKVGRLNRLRIRRMPL